MKTASGTVSVQRSKSTSASLPDTARLATGPCGSASSNLGIVKPILQEAEKADPHRTELEGLARGSQQRAREMNFPTKAKIALGWGTRDFLWQADGHAQLLGLLILHVYGCRRSG